MRLRIAVCGRDAVSRSQCIETYRLKSIRMNRVLYPLLCWWRCDPLKQVLHHIGGYPSTRLHDRRVGFSRLLRALDSFGLDGAGLRCNRSKHYSKSDHTG